MRRFLAFGALIGLVSTCSAPYQLKEEISFQSGQCNVVGELRIPHSEPPYPLVIFVHGDGPNNRTSGVTYPPIMERMLRAGYATFAWDKPGTGASTGEIDRNSLLEQRTQIVLDGLNAVRDHPLIVPDQIGLWGISQAGFVMPMVLKRNANIAFMIAVSCPGGPGFNQGVYLLSAQMACAGYPREKRLQVEARLRACSAAQTYEEYVEAKEFLISEPSFKRLAELGQRVDVTPRESWHREDFSKEYFSYDPMEIIEEVDIPILAIFGERDTQVDPFQGVEAYTRALKSGGNPKSAVKLFAGTDHNILLSETGCIGERNSRSRSGWQNYPPEYLDAIEAWLTSLR